MKTNYYKQAEVIEYAKDKLNDLKGSNIHGCDLHHEIFNTDYYIIGTWDAKQWCGSETFNIIEIIKDYEQDNFGEVNTDLSDPERVVNMYVYIVGEVVLQESKTLNNKWDVILNDDDLMAIAEEI
jgi:hypothetical protein